MSDEAAYAPAANRFVVPVKDGQLRFSNIETAIASAVANSSGVRDELYGHSYDAQDCVRIYGMDGCK
jgi:hypothetical protein